MENTPDMVDPKFPIGPFIKKDIYSAEEMAVMLQTMERSVAAYQQIATTITENGLSRTYRPGSWTVQQLYHHVADIQLVHYFRMKKVITEPDYKEVTLINMDGWASTADGAAAPIVDSLLMLEGITKRYVYLIGSLSDEQLQISYFHPLRSFYINQAQAAAMSAWHLQHHLAHINLALKA